MLFTETEWTSSARAHEFSTSSQRYTKIRLLISQPEARRSHRSPIASPIRTRRAKLVRTAVQNVKIVKSCVESGESHSIKNGTALAASEIRVI